MKTLWERYGSTSVKIDYVLIENQPVQKNPIMKSIQIMIYSFFVIQSTVHNSVGAVKLISARNKLKTLETIADKTKKDAIVEEAVAKAKCTSGYKYNKKLSILLAAHFIVSMKLSEETVQLFDHNKKKDDLADTFLQALNFINTVLAF
jgi:hypothetical protein